MTESRHNWLLRLPASAGHYYDARQEGSVTVNAQGLLAELFEARRARLQAVAYRMLGSSGRSRHEDLTDEQLPEIVHEGSETPGPEWEALHADSVGRALVVVLGTLSPAERLSFVLHDLFDATFDEIAPIIERSPVAARQLASRARRRIQGAEPPSTTDARSRHEVVAAFLVASRGGGFEALLTLLDPDVILRADPSAVRLGAPAESFGSTEVTRFLRGRAGGAQLALVDGVTGAVWIRDERPLVVFRFVVIHDLITSINLTAQQRPMDLLELKLLT